MRATDGRHHFAWIWPLWRHASAQHRQGDGRQISRACRTWRRQPYQPAFNRRKPEGERRNWDQV